MELTIKRGDIYYAELNPVIGSEQGGTRPVLIISNDIGNKHSPTVIIAPITSRVHTKAKLPTHTLIKDFDGLDKNSIVAMKSGDWPYCLYNTNFSIEQLHLYQKLGKRKNF